MTSVTTSDTIQFTTALSKRRIIELLRKDTLYTESIVRPSTPCGKTFFGQVNDDRIRVGNAMRYGRNPSPIFELFLSEKEDGTEVIIKDDCPERIALTKTITIIMPILFGGIVFIINTSLAIAQHNYRSIFYSIPLLAVFVAISFVNRFFAKRKIEQNRNEDRKRLTYLLKIGPLRVRELFS